MTEKNSKFEGKLHTIIGKGTKIQGEVAVEGSTPAAVGGRRCGNNRR